SAPMFWPMLAALRAMGADVEGIVTRSGQSLEALQDPDARFPFEVGIQLAFEAAITLGDEALGLHLAEKYQPGSFGVLDYLAHSSRTLGDAIARLCRYNRLLQDAVESALEVNGERAVLFNRLLGDVLLPPGVVENSLANHI